MVKPGGTSKAGRDDTSLRVKSHLSATRRVLARASGCSGKTRAISSGALQEELLGVEAEALLVLDLLARADAEQHVVGVGVVLEQVVRVVGGHEGQARALVDAGEGPGHPLLLLEAVLHDLEEEAALVEDLAELPDHPQGLGLVAVAQRHPDLAARGSPKGRRGRALCFCRTSLSMRGPVVEALGVADGHELHQVVVALEVAAARRVRWL